jgi:probable HAF family extracellular repeat protein
MTPRWSQRARCRAPVACGAAAPQVHAPKRRRSPSDVAGSLLATVVHSLRVGLLVLVVASESANPSAASGTYSVVDLGPRGGSFALNGWGHVLGTADGQTFLYDGAEKRDLGLGGANATGINDVGQVVGMYRISDDQFHAFLYDSGGLHDLGALDGSYSQANAINASGQVAGDSTVTGYPVHAFLYSSGVMRDLGTLGGASSYASSLNASGEVVGVSQIADPPLFRHAFLYDGTHMRDLGTLGGNESCASGINDAGQIVGSSYTSNNDWHAFLDDSGGMHDLGTLGGPYSVALAINSTGQIVGHSEFDARGERHAFLWQDGRMFDLNPLLPVGSGWVLEGALAINDLGQILGFGALGNPNEQRVYLLSPASVVPGAPPRAPSGLAVNRPPGDALTRFELYWADESDTESGFEVQRAGGGNDWVQVAVAPPNIKYHLDTDLAAYTHYRYRVRAVNGFGASAWSGEAGGDTGIGPVLRGSADGLEFGKQPVGTLSAAQDLTLTNAGNGALTLQSISLTGSGREEFLLLSGGGSGILAPGASRTLRVAFRPSATGSWSALLSIRDDADGSPHTVALSGAGGAPALSVGVSELSLPSETEFGRQLLGVAGVTRTVTLINSGSAPLKIDRITLAGVHSHDFALIADTGGRTLRPNASRALTIRFTPRALGRRSAVLMIRDNADGSPHQVALDGTGALPTDGAEKLGSRPTKIELLIAAVDGVAPRSSKTTVSVGQYVTLKLRLRFRNGAVAEVGAEPGVQFDASPMRGQSVEGNIWRAQPEDAGRTVILYGRYSSVPGQPMLVARVAIAVRRVRAVSR